MIFINRIKKAVFAAASSAVVICVSAFGASAATITLPPAFDDVKPILEWVLKLVEFISKIFEFFS